jgi:hypothetical protein
VATKKQRDRTVARRRAHRVNRDNLAPKIAQGITEGASAREALEEFPVQAKVDGAEIVQTHLGGDQANLEGTRIPRPRFVASDDTHSVWHDEPTGRLQRNAILKMDKETFQAMQAGHICLRCLEPQPEAFPDMCDLCGYMMRERQVMDIAMEFRGEAHVGPGAPIAEYLAEQEERLERLDYERRKKEGASPLQAVSRRILSPGAKKLRGLTGRVHADDALVEKAVKPDAP